MAPKQSKHGDRSPPPPPAHWRDSVRRWFDSVLADYELEPHHIHLLTLAAEALNTAISAREAIDKHGLTYVDRYGCPRARPECAIARDSTVTFARLVRELRLDIAEPEELRMPRSSGYGLKLKGAN